MVLCDLFNQNYVLLSTKFHKIDGLPTNAVIRTLHGWQIILSTTKYL
jgi:hypothetical protein